MQNRSDTPGEGLDPKALQALMDAIEGECDGLAIDEQQAASILEYVIAASPSVIGSDTAGLPSDCARLIDLLTLEAEAFEQLAAEGRNVSYVDPASAFGQSAEIIREAIAALSRAPEAVAEPEAFLIERLEGTGYGPARKVLDARQYDPRDDDFWMPGAKERHRITPLCATPPAPQPALALIEVARDLAKTYRTTGSFSTGMEYVRPIMSRLIAALSEQGEAAQPAAEGWEPEVEYEVWQNDSWTAGSTSLDDAKHYAAVYSQDGPVQLVKATTYREPISPGIASQAEEGSE